MKALIIYGESFRRIDCKAADNRWFLKMKFDSRMVEWELKYGDSVVPNSRLNHQKKLINE